MCPSSSSCCRATALTLCVQLTSPCSSTLHYVRFSCLMQQNAVLATREELIAVSRYHELTVQLPLQYTSVTSEPTRKRAISKSCTAMSLCSPPETCQQQNQMYRGGSWRVDSKAKARKPEGPTKHREDMMHDARIFTAYLMMTRFRGQEKTVLRHRLGYEIPHSRLGISREN